MKARLRSLLARLRYALFKPILVRLDALSDSTSTQLDDLAKRLESLEAVVQMIEGRSGTLTERSVAQQESQARLARRVDEIEKLLSQR